MLDLNQLKDKIHIRYKYISLIINKMIKPRTYKYINSGEDRSSKDCINENELFEFINDEKFIVQDEITRFSIPITISNNGLLITQTRDVYMS